MRALPWLLALVALLTLASIAQDEDARDVPTESRVALAGACVTDGCGCPHAALLESCCCVPAPTAKARGVAPARPTRRATVVETWTEARGGGPSVAWTSRECGGSKRSEAARAPGGGAGGLLPPAHSPRPTEAVRLAAAGRAPVRPVSHRTEPLRRPPRTPRG